MTHVGPHIREDLCLSAGLVAECQDIHISRCTTQRGTLEACGTQQHPPRFPLQPQERDDFGGWILRASFGSDKRSLVYMILIMIS